MHSSVATGAGVLIAGTFATSQAGYISGLIVPAMLAGIIAHLVSERGNRQRAARRLEQRLDRLETGQKLLSSKLRQLQRRRKNV